MDAEQIVQTLNENDIFDILLDLNANPVMTNNAIICRTICHHDEGGSNKLYYYYNTRAWVCYTHHCKIGNIFNLIMMAKDCKFIEAYNYICEKFGISRSNNHEERLDMAFFDKFKIYQEEPTILTPINKDILQVYHKYAYQGWLDEFISFKAMDKFDILFNVGYNRIIIPHYDLQGNLVGIRRRNLNESDIAFGKYSPEIYNKKQYAHPLGSNLYGYTANKEIINKSKKIIIFESEKAVMQLYSYNCELGGIALCGSSLTDIQFKLLLDVIIQNDIEEVVIALDKEWIELGDKLELFYQEKIRKMFIDKLLLYTNVSVIWDICNLLEYKDAPTDKGKDVWWELYTNRIKMI